MNNFMDKDLKSDNIRHRMRTDNNGTGYITKRGGTSLGNNELFENSSNADNLARVFEGAYERDSNNGQPTRYGGANDRANYATSWFSKLNGSGDISIPDYEIPPIMENNINRQMNQPQMIRIDGAVVEFKLEQLERVLRNKYEVSDEKTHQLLALLLKKLEARQQVIPQQSQQPIQLNDLFDDEIPSEYMSIMK